VVAGIEITVSGTHGLDRVEASLTQAKGGVGAKGAKVVRRNGAKLERLAKQFAPVDTGHLRNEIHTDQSGDGRFGALEVSVVSSTPYSIFVERGTSRMAPRAFLGPALDRVAPEFIADCEALADLDL
jgi:HK97 gp10 family phage protein